MCYLAKLESALVQPLITFIIKLMSIETLKLELISWILLLKDPEILKKIRSIKENSFKNADSIQSRQFGCGKGIFTYVADDFDATPPGFDEYMLP